LDHGGWDILRQFATTEMTLPQAEAALIQHLGNRFKDADWRPVLKAVMDAEGDVQKALNAIQTMSAACGRLKITIKLPAWSARPPQLITTEESLVSSVKVLQGRNRVFGQLLIVDELIEPVQERESLEDSPYAFPEGDKEIAEQVVHEQQVEQGEIIMVDDESDGEDDPAGNLTRRDAIELASKLEPLIIKYGSTFSDSTLDLSHLLRKFRGDLRREDSINSKQVTLDTFFGPPTI
jgi:hypothetical protein